MRSFRRMFTVLPACLLALAACRGDPVSPLPTSLTTDARAYVASAAEVLDPGAPYSLRVIVRFTNASRYAVARTQCLVITPYPPQAGVSRGGLPATPYLSQWRCSSTLNPDVAPGETRVDTLFLRLSGGINAPQAAGMGVIDGRFQVVFNLLGCRDGSSPCDDPIVGTASSNLFSIHRGP